MYTQALTGYSRPVHTMNRGDVTVHLHLFLTQHKVLIIYQLPTLTLLCQRIQPVLPGGPLGWHGHIWRELFTPVSFQNLHHAACM